MPQFAANLSWLYTDLPFLDRFEAAAKKAGIADIRRTGYSMEGAIMLARSIAKAPQSVLLSPACSSFDMYDNFEQRGRVFKGIVNAI